VLSLAQQGNAIITKVQSTTQIGNASIEKVQTISQVGNALTTTRKTYDVSSIPTGHIFLVTARNQAGDGAGLRNVNAVITYNSVGYSQDMMTQYHQSVSLTIPLTKVSGQNSVTVGYGGSATSQSWNTELKQIN